MQSGLQFWQPARFSGALPVGSPPFGRRDPVSDRPSIPMVSGIRDGSLLTCISAGSQGKPQLIGFEYDAPTVQLVSSVICGAE